MVALLGSSGSNLEREEGAPFLDVWLKIRNNGYVVGAYGALLEATDEVVPVGSDGGRRIFHLNASHW
jgi:hypothetical protein